MSLTRTTLAAAFTATDDVCQVTSATGATVNGFIKIDDELALIQEIIGTSIKIKRRGFDGTLAVAHATLAPTTFGLLSDLPDIGPRQTQQTPDIRVLTSIGADGAIPLPVKDTVFLINKATALASSAIPDPTHAQDGLEVTFLNATDAAHVVTFTSLHDGTTGLHTTATFAAFIGASLTVIAAGGKWLTKSAVACPIT